MGTCDSPCTVFQGITVLKTHKKHSYKQTASSIVISESHLNDIRLCNIGMAFWGVIWWWNSGKKHCNWWYGFLGSTQWKKALYGAIWLFGENTVEKSTDCSFYSPKSRPPAKATNLRWPSSWEPLWPTTCHSGKKHWAIVALIVENVEGGPPVRTKSQFFSFWKLPFHCG